MDHYQHNLMAGQVLDVDFLSHQMPLDGTGYQVPEGALMISQPIKSESYDMAYMDFFEDPQHYQQQQQQPPPDSRSYSCSSMTSQSRSPPIQAQNAELHGLQMHNLQSSAQPEQTSPTMTNDSKKESDDEGEKTERRRAQNRAAQRAYRQRKDHSLKQRELEIEGLREELEKAQRLNKTLCKVVSVLRERLKEDPEGSINDET